MGISGSRQDLSELPPNPNRRAFVTFSRWTRHQSAFLGTYVVYTYNIKYDRYSWDVTFRFNDLIKLEKYLIKNYPHIIFAIDSNDTSSNTSMTTSNNTANPPLNFSYPPNYGYGDTRERHNGYIFLRKYNKLLFRQNVNFINKRIIIINKYLQNLVDIKGIYYFTFTCYLFISYFLLFYRHF